MAIKCDFSGWATRNDLLCSDGRTIRKDAFKGNDGQTVPLVWNHQHNDPDNVLGHALLENRNEGVYSYCFFNDSESGQAAKKLVNHGDVKSLSIYANNLKQQGGNVLHGAIREVSLVLAGANPGAFIDNVMAHSEGESDGVIVGYDENIVLYHAMDDVEELKPEAEIPAKKPAASSEKTIEEVFNELTEEQKNVVYFLLGSSALSKSISNKENNNMYMSHADNADTAGNGGSGRTVKDVFDEMTEEQKNVVYFLIGQAVEEKGGKTNNSEDENMKHNAFENNYQANDDELMHSAMDAILGDAKRFGSVKESFLAHAEEYGIDNIDYLFPDDRNPEKTPQMIARDTSWVKNVMGGVHHVPFSRVKSMFADITEDQARAKGYIKGKLKKEEVFSLLKRSTTPTTVYKKQKMDRDDIIDITDFDVVAWLKTEMRGMLDEELARAYLIGDGRLASDEDHIDEQHIRPILNDNDLFVIRWSVDDGSGATDLAKNFIKAAVKSRKNYKGSGNPTLYTTEDMLTEMLLLEDTQGYRLYKTESELATAMRVKNIVTVPVMENLEDKDSKDVYGIIVNMGDYTVGADKGGAINMFDDFDIDYNQQKYLIETRCSAALTKPFSAIVLREGDATASEEPTMAQIKAQL